MQIFYLNIILLKDQKYNKIEFKAYAAVITV